MPDSLQTLLDLIPAPIAAAILWLHRRLSKQEDLAEKSAADCVKIQLRQTGFNADYVRYDRLGSIIRLHIDPIKSDVAEIKADLKQLLLRRRNDNDSR